MTEISDPGPNPDNFASAPTSTPTPTETSYQHREHIIDRTGDAVRQIAAVIEGQHRSVLASAQEPNTGTPGIFLLKPGGQFEALNEHHFDGFREAPVRITDKTVATRLPSFIALVNRFKNAASSIFALESASAPKLTAIIDYHDAIGGDPLPAFAKHTISYPFPLSPEWKTWIEANGRVMTMADFAAFIEDNIVNVEQVSVELLSEEAQGYISKASGKLASPTDLYNLSRGLTVHENSQLVQATNLATGEAQAIFKSEHVDGSGQPLSIPNMFVIVIPVWDKSPDYYRIVARLRYRKRDGGLVFWYELWRADLIFQTAFDEVIEQVRDETEQPVYIGSANRSV